MKKDNLVKFLYKNGKKPQEIARQLDVTVGYVYKIIKLEGIKTYKNKSENAVYHTEEYKEFRKRVIERDGGKCVKCGKPGSKLNRLQVDHILAKATHLELIFELSNARTLCSGCHKKEPTTRIYRKFNKDKR